MNLNSRDDQTFVSRLTAIVEANLSDEQFGVNELAAKTGLSRSQIHRRLKKAIDKSFSQFIREIRLEKAKEFLKLGNLTVSEIAYKVGFGSPSYFIKSFHDYFGYPPGEYKNKEQEEELKKINTKKKTFNKPIWIFSSISIIVIVLALIAGKYFVFEKRVPVEKTIIVLPFKNLFSDENKQIYADIISYSIRDYLTKIPGLKIKPYTTSEQFRETSLSSPEIARLLNVVYIVDGYVRQQGDKVRVNVVLIDALKDDRLWGHEYNWERKDIFDIEDDIGKEVANSLQSILSSEEIKQIEKSRPKNPEAYNNYQMGQYFCLKRDSVSIYKGIEYFEKAIQIDSNYTFAFAGLADAYYALSFTGNIERKTGYDMAYKMAEKALEKDSTLAEAYAVLGVVSKFGYWEWEKARDFFGKALEIDSNCMVAHLYYCSFLDIVGEPEKAIYHANRAIEIEPLYHMPYHMKGVINYHKMKYEESIAALRKSIELNPKNGNSYEYIFYNYVDLNDEISAISILQELFANHSGYQKFKNGVKTIYETKGINGLLKLYLDAALEQDETSSLFLIPSLNAKLGMQNEALTYLEKACRVNDRDISRMIRMQELEILYSNPRFQALVDTMNLRPYFHETTE